MDVSNRKVLAHLKAYICNIAQPKGPIDEGYIAEECLTFFSRYFDGVETLFNHPRSNGDSILDADKYLCNTADRSIGKVKAITLDGKSLKQAHHFVILQPDVISKWHSKFLEDKCREFRPKRANGRIQERWLSEEFPGYIETMVVRLEGSNEEGNVLKALVRGPNNITKTMKALSSMDIYSTLNVEIDIERHKSLVFLLKRIISFVMGKSRISLSWIIMQIRQLCYSVVTGRT